MRILVVEDDGRLATNLRRGLERSSFAVDVVSDGEEAIAAGLATAYDVIVLDRMLPSLDGTEVIRALRSRKVQTPVLMLTAKDSVDDRVAGLEAGADDYLVKPFALREVVARIQALTRRHIPERGSVLVAGPMALDTSAHLLVVEGHDVDLTAKEYAILEVFLLHKDQVISRDQLIEHVWSYDFDSGPNLVEVYIARLRRKLTEAGAADPFVTVRGAGYRFDSRKV
ncbi:MAG: response regulator transcription factor [Candidatus Dormibacteraeota bacterium]|nr:response regulator transcription factor [Candidatus Dormibacteraeota bacterium]